MDYGIIGRNLTYSFSPQIHAMLGCKSYVPFVIKDETELKAFFSEKNFKGINVTIPYKEKVMEFCDEISERAKEIGAVNAILNKDGKLYGFNTDYNGLVATFEHHKVDLKNKNVFILGTGGAAKTAFTVCKSLFAKPYFVSRTKSGENCVSYDELYSSDADIIINATPVGMAEDKSPIKLNFKNLSFVLDVNYNPLKSKLIQLAEEQNIKAVNGVLMLAAQARAAAEIFYSDSCDVSAIEIAKIITKMRTNIVLIGMPSSGKTTLGKALAQQMNRKFFDVDEEIEKAEDMSIEDIFSKKGEEYFRTLEAEVCKNLAKETGAIIATGGGSVLNAETVRLFKQNGKIVFINRTFENLLADRPVAKTKEDLKILYETRLPIYKKIADIEIENLENWQTLPKQIEEIFDEISRGQWT